MAKYKLKIYPSAKRDLKEIISHLNTLSPQSAIKYYDLMVDKIGSLTEMPERCPFARNVVLKARGYRYLVFYLKQNLCNRFNGMCVTLDVPT